MDKPFRIIFMGSPDFAVPTLERLVREGHEIVSVYTQPPRGAGRGKAPRPTPIAERAAALGLPVCHPESLASSDAQTAFAALEADVAIVVAYGLILPQPILDTPRLGCINLHASLLPRWRGAAPIQRAIMAGDTETGVQAMIMEAGLDTGPILATARTPITPDDTAAHLHDRLADLGANLLPATLQRFALGHIEPEPQAETGVTYARKLGSADQRIDWSCSSAAIDAQIRGLSARPGAWFAWTPPGASDPIRIKALMSQTIKMSGPPGTVLDDQLTVACGDGAVQIMRAQRPGKGPMDASDFLRGSPVHKGTHLT